MITYYQILNIEPAATSDQIKQAYRTKAKLTHPDHGGNERDFQLLNEAYNTLSDPSSRATYDSQLGLYAYKQQAQAQAASDMASRMRRNTDDVAASRKKAEEEEGEPLLVSLFRVVMFIGFIIYLFRTCS
jgi:curved DNA-binding protein CbpA